MEGRFDIATLTEIATACFEKAGVPHTDAAWAAYSLVKADLLGRSTHGLSRLKAYVTAIEAGKINPTANVEVSQTGPSSIMVDGDGGLGPVVAKHAMDAAISAARTSGVAAAAVHHGNHAGAMSIYTTLAADAGMIGLGFSNAQPAIPPWGGRRAFFGTNPIAMAAGMDLDQMSVDMATSVAARGNIILAAKTGQPIPDHWAIDENGVPTTDAKAALAGAVLPMAGPKGYALATMVEVLAGVLTGAAVADEVGSIYDANPEPANTGLFFLVIDPSYFVGTEQFLSRLAKMERDIRAVPVAEGYNEIRLPGERSRMNLERGLQEGIALSRETVQEIESLCHKYDLLWGTNQ
ncbi:Ldh family oxidoreductase [Alicyclobacillus dauci]|uniref:Ldh family oxidoreductase n=1 Tax=Alicyclobacillus dauci TaxID=1475485 RepID=A0ABY6Z886_9BACL|nr:Ldh family oxidoreductase [Alicyclobacillus dauci]WAH38381.1 Ldh family oxidoreductase [Alicyclobacillus dauci]